MDMYSSCPIWKPVGQNLSPSRMLILPFLFSTSQSTGYVGIGPHNCCSLLSYVYEVMKQAGLSLCSICTITHQTIISKLHRFKTLLSSPRWRYNIIMDVS